MANSDQIHSHSNQIEHASTAMTSEEPGNLNLMDLPEIVLLKIFSFFSHDLLRHVAAKVSVAFRKLARTPCLWETARLTFTSYDCWDCAQLDKFISDLQVTPFVSQFYLDVAECEDHDKDKLIQAILRTRCKISKLHLKVENYGPEWVLMLQRHPEITMLTLQDSAVDYVYSQSFAAIVSSLVPRLHRLDLSRSMLPFLPKAGKALSEFCAPEFAAVEVGNPPPPWSPADHSNFVPSGAEPNDPSHSGNYRLDVRGIDSEVDKDKAWQEVPRKGQGLRVLVYSRLRWKCNIVADEPFVEFSAKNISALIRSQRHSLECVKIDLSHCDVFQAMSEIDELKEVTLFCDETGQAVCDMLEVMSAQDRLSGLTRLHLALPAGATTGAKVLATLNRCHPPNLRVLKLSGACLGDPVFPGFAAIERLLVGSPGRAQPPALAEIRLTDLASVGRAEVKQLEALARGPLPLSLRKLEVRDCACSAGRSWAQCREGAVDDLLRVMPHLYVEVSATMAESMFDAGFIVPRGCDCERPPRPPRPRQPRGGPGGDPRPRRRGRH